MARTGIGARLMAALRGGERLKAAEMRVAELEWELSKMRPFEDAPSYSGDMMATWYKSVDFLTDPRFMAAYRRGMDSGHILGRPEGSRMDIHIEWRIHTCCWAGAHALKLEGDFVECGVNTGIMSLAVCDYVDFNSTGRSFWLFDTFQGIPMEQLTEEERAEGKENAPGRYFDCYDLAKANFAPFPNARLVQGMVPETLSQVEIEKVAYLSIDMNIVEPERAALAHFWPKLVPGAVVVLDDYGWQQYGLQKKAHDAFARSQGTEILLLPTGQGLMVKP